MREIIVLIRTNNDLLTKKSDNGNKKILGKNFVLNKKSPYKWAKITKHTIEGIVITAILFVFSSSLMLPKTTYDIKALSPTIKDINIIPITSQKPKPVQIVDIQEELVILEVQQQVTEELAEEKLFNDTIKNYCNIYELNYNDIWPTVKEHEDEIKNNYSNQELGILTTINNIYRNNNTIDKSPIKYDITSSEREQLLLKYASIYELYDVDTVATLLAIYRLETGYGTSNACVNKNNLGGLRDMGSKGYYILSYRSPEIGAIAMVRTFVSIMNKSLNSKHYNPNKSLEYNMNRIYCGASDWPIQVGIIKKEVLKDYNLEQFIQEEKDIQLTKK